MYKFIVIIFFLFISVKSSSEIIKSIEITGNKRVSDETIKVYGDIQQTGSDITKADLDVILKNLYSTNFFENVSLVIDKGILKINVKEYPIVNQLVLIGEKSTRIQNEIKKQFLKEGFIYRK